MKTDPSPKTTRHALRDSLPCLCLWLLAAGLPVAVLGQSNYATPYTFTTLAGSAGASGTADGIGSAARFYNPWGAAADGAGNVYAADELNFTIRKMTLLGTNWVVTTLAGLAGSSGTNDGTGRAARFSNPTGVAVDSAGNVYVADSGKIRKVTPAAVVTTLAGVGGGAVAVDGGGNLYLASGNSIEQATPFGTNWIVTTLAGVAGSSGSADGTGSAARFDYPNGLAADGAGNVYVADSANYTIRKVTPAGVVTTLAGLAGRPGSADGTGSAARFGQQGAGPAGVAVDSAGIVYVADTGNFTIRKVTPAGLVTTLAGRAGGNGSADGTGSAAQFGGSFYYTVRGGIVIQGGPEGLAVDNAGNVYVADTENNTLRKVTTGAVVTTLAGRAGSAGTNDGTGSAAQFGDDGYGGPRGLAADGAGNVYVADTASSTIREVTPAGLVTTLAGLAGTVGSVDGTNSDARFNNPYGVALDRAGNVYVADTDNFTIRKVTPAGVVTTLAGLAGISGTADGTGSAARFYYPRGVAVDGAGDVYVADMVNCTIRKVTPAGLVTTLAGLAGSPGSADGTRSAAAFLHPGAVAVDNQGNVYVGDTGNNTIRKVTPAGVVTTLAGLGGCCNIGSTDGTGSAARFYYPSGLALDSAGNLYVADFANDTIRKVTPAGGVTTLAGLAGPAVGAGVAGSADGTGSAARFYDPSGVAVDSAGNLYVADTFNNTIRKGFPASLVPAPILQPPILSGSQFSFGITGLPNLPVDLESSDDFSQWQAVGTYFLEGWTNYFLSPNPPQGAQYYRAHVR